MSAISAPYLRVYTAAASVAPATLTATGAAVGDVVIGYFPFLEVPGTAQTTAMGSAIFPASAFAAVTAGVLARTVTETDKIVQLSTITAGTDYSLVILAARSST